MAWVEKVRAPTLRWLALCAGASTAAFASPVHAQAPTTRTSFSIPAQDVESALIAFAVQAHVSTNTERASFCQSPSKTVDGVYRPSDALQILLAGTGCSFQITSTGAIIIEPQPAPAVPAALESEVIVTAGRRSFPLSKAPFAVSVLEGAALGESGAGRSPGIDALTGYLAGVTVTNLGPGRNKMFLRGLSDGPLTGRTQSTVAHYEDNVRIAYDAPEPDLPLIDIDRVEVLRGPQGALYGGGSIGGVLQVITKAPDPSGFAANIGARSAITEGGAPSSAVQGMVNLPFGENAALRIVGWQDRQGGVLDDVALNLRNTDQSDRNGTRVRFTARPWSNWRLSAGLTRQTIDSADTHYATAGLGPYQRALTLREPHDNDFAEGYISLERSEHSWNFIATSALVRHEINSTYDASDARALFAPALTGAARFSDDNVIEMLVNEVRLTSQNTGRVNWILGGFLSAGENTSQALFVVLPPGQTQVQSYSEARKDHIGEAALYGQVTFDLTKKISAIAGLRWFGSRLDGESRIERPPALANTFKGRVSNSGAAPALTLSYAASDRTVFYALASEGYRPGGINTADGDRSVYALPGGGQPARYFKSDELWNYEIGLRTSLVDDAVRIRVAAFGQHWTDVQADRLLPSGLSFTSNAGDARNAGLEFEARYLATDEFSIDAHGSWNNPELTHVDPSFPGTADSGLPGVPNLSFGLGAKYQKPLTSHWRTDFAANLEYVGPSHLTFDAVTAPKMGDYSNLSLLAAVSSPRWRLSVFVDNALNSAGDTFAYGNPFSLRLRGQATPQRPRSVGVGLERAF